MILTLLYTLSGGMLIILSTGRPAEIAWRFLRLVALLAFGLGVGTTVWLWRNRTGADADGYVGAKLAGAIMSALLIGVILLSPFAPQRPTVFRGLAFVAGLAGVIAACRLSLVSMSADAAPWYRAAFVVLGQVLAAWLLGSITVAWLLGHAYLTATKMTIAPLRHFSGLLMWGIGLRSAFVLLSMALAWWRESGADAPEAGSLLLRAMQNAWMILSLRVGVGLLAVGVFAWMVRDCVRLRSTQSATGILYFGSVFAYVGELASQQLSLECGWPM